MDFLARAFSDNYGLLFRMARVTDVARELEEKHRTDPVGAVLLAEALVCASLLLSELKSGQEKVTLNFEGQGRIERIIVEATAFGDLRGTISGAAQRESAKPEPGFGTEPSIAVTYSKGIDVLSSQRLMVLTPDFRNGLAQHLGKSLATRPVVEMFVDHQAGRLHHAVGLVVEPMAKREECELGLVAQKLGQTEIRAALAAASSVDILRELFPMDDLHVVEITPLRHQCWCSMEQYRQEILAYPRKKLALFLRSGHPKVVTCSFCRTVHTVRPETIRELLGADLEPPRAPDDF